MDRIDRALLDAVAREAAQSPRLRASRALPGAGGSGEAALLALQPGTYVRPHWHLDHERSSVEILVALQGEIGVLELDAEGRVIAATRARSGSDVPGALLRGGVFHTRPTRWSSRSSTSREGPREIGSSSRRPPPRTAPRRRPSSRAGAAR